MASLKALKVRIGSVKSTQKITKAMKMVAAAKLRRAQEAAEAGRPYAQRLEAVVASLASKVSISEASPKLLAGTGKDQVHLFVVATSDKGLAGAFNTNIARLARRRAQELIAEGKTVKFYTIGKKGRAVLNRLFPKDMAHSIEPGDLGKLGFADARGYADDLIARFEAGEFDVAHLFYSNFKSVLTQEPTEQQIIPVAIPAAPEGDAAASAVTEYEPGEEEILADLLGRNVAIQLYRAIRENAASEQGSKMTAMDNATRNAGDLIKRLSIQYNRARQAAITTELVEIISGAEAL
ncbi:F0F1 ATP synthase subunit gamma [Sphingomonas koreensis]|jgi:F-type H+-transporting ATPase subunit gamma|uniref:ATP synthase gamma chain n=1 Tax=Sphingomonas koreensis TaxID=93064 RepID=A0A1L6J9U3_9SPHN|nr:F0F1 ATP synthase subunit gamma [Sphingomonas koreensis]APR52703.1 F0F1 ATP synthase subunit gamma [Sphingomonas koreensis]MDC7812645.1 F0F1 ATP synthase subunit gamma [Sphingomonas koreensis]PJI87723.1 F-type H+-transporting ATPase subunit gamma [Sphingomonas koreensis]RSU19205.1 F0F1 ATP synthase subunit gamma [Sphingomonas koreensis]RSU28472.1 F0F1 ATP synthase subunit gamma [Sphingomonas koreensis]